MRRRNGCDRPHQPGHGIKTILGTEILECPNRRIPHHLAALVRAYGMGGGQATWESFRVASPLFVEAMLLMRRTLDRLSAERIKLASKRGAGDGN